MKKIYEQDRIELNETKKKLAQSQEDYQVSQQKLQEIEKQIQANQSVYAKTNKVLENRAILITNKDKYQKELNSITGQLQEIDLKIKNNQTLTNEENKLHQKKSK